MRFIGRYDTIPKEGCSNTYVYQQDYGFLRDDKLLIIAPEGTTTDGASIPRFMWRLVGHPLYSNNKFWSAPHDCLYSKCAIVIDCGRSDSMTPEAMFMYWRDLSAHHFLHQCEFSKRFADETLLQAMKACNEPRLKQFAVYRSVRLFGRGWWAKKKR